MISAALITIYDFFTSPSQTPEAYKYLPSHGAILPLVLINVAFVLFAFRIGPWLMRNREPFNLKRAIIVYNVFQIAFNFLMFILGCRLLVVYLNVPNSLGCIEQLAYDHSYKGFETFCGLLYFFNKFLDYMETIFFILRKSFKQVTFLHVYHHIMMTTSAYAYFRIQGSGGHVYFGPFINTVIHMIMYYYYLASSINGNMKNRLWWKKYITQLQLLQFIIAFIHLSFPLFILKDCPFPKIWLYIALSQAIMMIYLFSKFYIDAYVRKPKSEKVLVKKL